MNKECHKLFAGEKFREAFGDPDEVPLYCCLVEGGQVPKVYHKTLRSAEKEAKRLVDIENKPCTIMKRICVVKPVEKFDITYFE